MTEHTHRTSLLTSIAGRAASALGKSLRCRLRFSPNVLHIRLAPILGAALRFTQVRAFWLNSPWLLYLKGEA